jgi:CRP/FNR family transcriptional regulator, cyclic AMP receptor protein
VENVGSLFDLLPEAERGALREAARRRQFGRAEILFHEGEPGESMHVIESGHVAIRLSTPRGEVGTLVVLGPGQSFGEQALLSVGAARTASAVAVDSVVTLSFGRRTFDELRARSPVVDRFLVAVMAQQVRRLSEQLVEALYVDAETRVLRRVLRLAEAYAAVEPGGALEAAVVPYTQDEIAAMAGTTRPTVNRALQAAREVGAIELGRGRVMVIDRAALSTRAWPDGDEPL